MSSTVNNNQPINQQENNTAIPQIDDFLFATLQGKGDIIEVRGDNVLISKDTYLRLLETNMDSLNSTIKTLLDASTKEPVESKRQILTEQIKKFMNLLNQFESKKTYMSRNQNNCCVCNCQDVKIKPTAKAVIGAENPAVNLATASAVKDNECCDIF